MKIRKRQKHLNDLLLSKPVGRHDPKLGKKISRAKRKHSQNKEERDA